MRVVVWFRADLRTDDNPALAHACAVADRGVVGVFCVCPRQWRRHDWANVKVEFLLRNLTRLSERLKRANIPLLVQEPPTFNQVPRALFTIVRQLECDAVYFNREYEVNERRRDAAVMDSLSRAGVEVRHFDDQTIVPPGDVRTKAGGFYTVFTPFRRAWLARIQESDMRPRPGPRRQAELICAPDPVPRALTGFDLSSGHPADWPSGEDHAAARLATFTTERLATYWARRDLPALEGTSCLSPYLALGVLSPRRCLAAAREVNKGQLAGPRAGPTTWITELIWRDFYRHVLVGFPRVSMNRAFKPETESLPWREDQSQFGAWCAGRTGFPLVDAGMRQLAQTGWMHNRLRMITAMFLAKYLFIDWRRGERYFMRQLIDGDLASNNGGWQWSASTGTDAVPYFRVFNPFLQARKFDAEAEFIRRWVPELEAADPREIHDPVRLERARRAGLAYAKPICDATTARRRVIEAFQRLRGARHL